MEQQQLMADSSLLLSLNHQTTSHGACVRIWDPVNARFEECSIPFILAIPAVVSVVIALGYAFRAFCKSSWWPEWSQPFIKELPEPRDEVNPTKTRKWGLFSTTLLFVSAVGLGLQLLTVLYPNLHIYQVFPTASWAIACAILIFLRPESFSPSLFLLYVSLLVSQLIAIGNREFPLPVQEIPSIINIMVALAAVTILLCMPLRNPRLSAEGIGPAFGPPTDQLRSPEDNLTLFQFMSVSWVSPLISLGKKRQLNDDDVWFLGLEFQHRHLHDRFKQLQGSVLRRLFVANGLDLIIISLLGILQSLAILSSPVLLQKILQSMEDPNAPRRAAVTYTLLSLVVRLISCQASILSLWYGRRTYERSRGELITMLFDKALSRKIVASHDEKAESKISSSESVIPEQNGSAKKGSVKGWWHDLRSAFTRFKERTGLSRKSDVAKASKEAASMGKVMNLTRGDAYEVAQRFWEFASFVTQPLMLVISIILVWRLIGWSCLIGVVTVVFAQAINAMIARSLISWEKTRRLATDDKLHKITQLVESIRHLRWYGWQNSWLSGIMEARQHELNIRIVTSSLQTLINFTNTFSSGMFPVVAFYAYTVWAGQPLRVDIAFPALQLFSMLENSLRELPDLITVLLNARVALSRIDDFMAEPNKSEADESLTPNHTLTLEHASFSWPGLEPRVLHNIDLTFSAGLNVIIGEVGAGKTALLQALLGELDQRSGTYERSSEMVGYCAQSPWLQSMSIRENILFSEPYNDTRYRQVMDACALIPDMANFKHGDLSLIGENGIGLSGGQRARVALARAVYSSARILLLDDPLSALDHQTADLIVRRCLVGQLTAGRTVVLVTHRTELCLSRASKIVEVKNGETRVFGPGEMPVEDLQRVTSQESTSEETKKRDEEQENAAIPDKFMEDEHRAEGGVKASVYWQYIKAGKLKFWILLVACLGIYRLVTVGQTWWLKEFGDAYDQKSSMGFLSFSTDQIPFQRGPSSSTDQLTFRPSPPNQIYTSRLFPSLPSPEENVRPWLFGFFIITALRAITYLICQIVLVIIIYKAGRRMFKKVMIKVTHASFRYYDVTPVGRLMNRLTSDISTIDGNISGLFQGIAMQSISWTVAIIVIASVTPVFLVFAMVLTLSYVFIFLRFLPTSQSLRRLEMVSLSPLMSNFGALLDGLTTVRAFGAQRRFQQRVIEVCDLFQKNDHFYWSVQAWLMYRFEVLSAVSTALITLIALYTNTTPGLTAFVLTAAGKFVNATHYLCRQYGQLQMDFVSVERVVEMLHIDQESPGTVDPPAWWPSLQGDIVFDNVTIRYAPHLDPAISNVSFTIKAGATAALIGRTGSGKSTLALSLLATVQPESGRILVDGTDLATVNTQALRSRITFLAQDPVLFPGTMRQNLDPLDEYTDEACAAVLSKIAARHGWALSTAIDTGGKNLSQGQRQLVGLARALLRRSPIVVMDEATASIDAETAMGIQRVLREEMRESTVITIAHRVEAVRGADFCVVLSKGKLVSAGPAGENIEEMAGGDE
ncbi:ABC bile acid transporter-like protein [Aulographum hederae CBS 113979]|uniref:ABC bile acid transporter-like protein n=1 Tax=Aulographum hederae CBS 113979 TaxID=1176131 RepID=A0A6G1GP04_9PEZI|nr:ABC bile acid transporter-like protein [Aulographum hederae CBS 113979]